MTFERSKPQQGGFAMAVLTDADCALMRLSWLAGLFVWRDVPSYLSELGDERGSGIVIRGSSM